MKGGPPKPPLGRRRLVGWGVVLLLGFGALLVYMGSPEAPAVGIAGGSQRGSALPAVTPEVSTPERLGVRVVRTFPHDRRAFTQGLLWHEGRFYESTGQYGSSSLRRWDPESGEIEEITRLPVGAFGEGLARVGDRLVQLTWHEGVAFVWSLEGFELLGQHHYRGEGWGLTFDGEHLVMSDGSATLTFRDPETFEEVRRVEVTLEGRPHRFLNELEHAEGAIWANVWTTETVVRIDPETGVVTAVVDASALVPRDEPGIDVLNGVAYNPEIGTFFLTGKLWPVLYEVELLPAGEEK